MAQNNLEAGYEVKDAIEDKLMISSTVKLKHGETQQSLEDSSQFASNENAQPETKDRTYYKAHQEHSRMLQSNNVEKRSYRNIQRQLSIRKIKMKTTKKAKTMIMSRSLVMNNSSMTLFLKNKTKN